MVRVRGREHQYYSKIPLQTLRNQQRQRALYGGFMVRQMCSLDEDLLISRPELNRMDAMGTCHGRGLYRHGSLHVCVRMEVCNSNVSVVAAARVIVHGLDAGFED